MSIREQVEQAGASALTIKEASMLGAIKAAILIRERLYVWHPQTTRVIDDLVASLVSAETPQVQDEKAFARCDQSGRSTADPRVDDRGGSWQPIATAPKNGTRVLVSSRAYGVTYYGFCHWQSFDDGSSGWIGGSFATIPPGCFSAFLNPTHWMPLPSPPETP